VLVLNPSNFHIGIEGIKTIIGSHVAVCMYSTGSVIGMCSLESVKSGEKILDLLVQGMLGAGHELSSLRAKIFGGAAVFGESVFGSGEKLAQFVKAYLWGHGIAITSDDTGGCRIRMVYFSPNNDYEVLVQKAGGMLFERVHENVRYQISLP
jgi:chemotaxis receptor (MCP) glutamine deamidase CheD